MRNISFLSRNVSKKTMRVSFDIDGVKKTVVMQDLDNETENLRSWCRELKKFEDEIGGING